MLYITGLATFSGLVATMGVFGNVMLVAVVQYSYLHKQTGYSLVTSIAVADIGEIF